MPKKLASEVDSLVRALSRSGLSNRDVVKALKKDGINISRSTVQNVLSYVGNRRNHKSVGLKSPKVEHKQHVKVKRSRSLIGKVNTETCKENPPSQRAMARKFRVSQDTIRKIINEDLRKKVKKKPLVHTLKATHKANRRTNCRKLYEGHLAGQKSEYVVSLDEAWFYLQDCGLERRIYYKTAGEVDPEFVTQRKEKFGEKFMVVGAITGRGTVPLITVPGNVKINANYYINDVLKPLLEGSVAKLYPNETHKVFVHHDKASSHTSRKTALYAADLKRRLGMTIINNDQIPVKSPDCSPMDFFGFGVLKQRLHMRRATTIQGVRKVLDDEWSKITPETVRKVFDCWKPRCRLISRTHGEHVEKTKKNSLP